MMYGREGLMRDKSRQHERESKRGEREERGESFFFVKPRLF
jgi:hypothetical protein